MLGLVVALVALVAKQCEGQELLPGPVDGWQYRFRQEANAVRILEVVPAKWTKAKRRLIVFATPNGNTLEQSYGAQAQEGRDWHFDIQHIGAQFRYAQSHCDEADLALVVVQSGQLSWPAFRQTTDGADKQIRRLIESLQANLKADETYLTCHSGGGSLIWGWMNAHEELPASVTRIALLDANYSYADELHHGDKLLKWLRNNAAARLLVMAYDDRNVEFQGKKVVSDDGGTYRATERMVARFEKDEPVQRGAIADLQSDALCDGRALLLRHPNPKKVILHTALVGEFNSFAFACLWGQASEAEAKPEALLAGPRCYKQFIMPDPIRDPNRGTARRVLDAPIRQLSLPPRAADAESGSAFIARVAGLDRTAREQAVFEAVSAGNVPSWSRQLIPIKIETAGDASPPPTPIYVLQDYLAIGSDDDAVRMPMTPATAWKLCEQLNCSLPTARLCDEIFSAAQIRLMPKPMTKDRDQVETFLEHHQLIEKQLRGKARDGIIVGHKKDVINSHESLEKENRVVIYGWHYPSGVPIQPVYAGHVAWYTDYSHGVRFVAQ